MKRLNIISLITVAFAFGFASCADQVEEFKKGAPDAANCYGVYFPAQNTTLVLDPAEPTFDTILVARTKTEGAITVPYVLKDDNKIFEATELKFEDGQTESFIVVKFDSAKVGITYVCSIIIEDPTYASQYTSNAIAIDLSVSRDKWVSLGDATFTDYFFGVQYKAELLQNDKDKSKYRLMHPYDSLIISEILVGDMPGAANGKESEYMYFKVLKPGEVLGSGDDAVKITKEDLVYFSVTQIGWNYNDGTYVGDVVLVHPFNFGDDESEYSYSKVLQYQKKDLPAGIQLAPFYFINGAGVGWDRTNRDGVVLIVFPGAILTDYTLEIEEDFSEDGQQDVAFTLGSDLAFVDYAVYEGALNASQIETKLEAILACRDTTIKADKDTTVAQIDSTCVVAFTFPSTGKYTLIAVGYDTAKHVQATETLVLNYVASKDSVPVDIYAELISTKKYERTEKISSDNCLEYTIFGSDLTGLKMGLFKSEKFAKDTLGYINSMIVDKEKKYAVSSKVLDQINETGLTDLFVKLNPGTPYTLVLIATNGYEQKILMLDATTTGDPLPLFIYYDWTEIDLGLLPDSAAGYNGEYDFLAVRGYGKTGDRELISTFNLKAINDSIVMATGLFGDEMADDYITADTVYYEYFEGVLYTLSTVMLGDSGVHAAIRYYSSSAGKSYGWDNDYAMLGGFIDKDHIAFVDNFTGAGINGWTLTAYADSACEKGLGNFEIFIEPLFAKSGIYDDVLGIKRKTSSSTLNMISAALRAPRTNYVESERGYIRSTIRNIRNAEKIASYNTSAGYAIVPEPRSVAAKVVAVKAYEKPQRLLEKMNGKIRF